MEKLRYPYEPGRFGINFKEIFQLYKNGKTEGAVISGSGRKIRYEIEKDILTVSDWDSVESRILSAGVKASIATFDLKTKVSKLDEDQKFPWQRHPDLFAGEFVALALRHFENEGTKVKICKGLWSNLSDNYAIYEKEFRHSGDKVKAAKKTWSGQTFIKCGFTEIRNRNIYCFPNLIEANFHKPAVQFNS